jgi:hypothetical protein
MFEEFWNRLQREVKANGKKAGVLAALLLLGCCIWIPMVTRAVCRTRPAVASKSPSAPPTKISAAPSPAVSSAPEQPEFNTREFWTKLSAVLEDDPMFQTAGIQPATRDPFQAAEGQEPLPVLFAQEPAPTTPVDTDHDADGLELRSTIIGSTRRAALINGQLYQLGRKIQTDDRQYVLTRIESNRVVLSSGERTIELTLTRPQLKDVLNRNQQSGPPVQ